MFTNVLIVSCFLILLDIQVLCKEIQKCNGNVTSCVQNSAHLSQFYISSSSNSTYPKNIHGKNNSRVHKRRKNSNRRKNIQRKVHRHSTRVLSLKPSAILLPPFENDIHKRNISTLNPFIINVLSDPRGKSESYNFITSLPRQEKKTINKPTPNIVMLDRNPGSVQEPKITSVTEHVQNPIIVPPPKIKQTSTDTPYPNSDLKSPPLNEIKPRRTFPPPSRYLLPPLENVRNNELNPQQLEKTNNFRITDVTDGNYVETSTSFFNQQPHETSSFSSLTTEKTVDKVEFKQIVSYDNNSFSSFETTVQPVQNYFNSTIVASDNANIGKGHVQETNSHNSLNNTLLAPDIESLGMKIVTSKKGLEMIKELTSSSKSKPADKNYERSHSNLETAESGDIRLHTYNQILSIEETKDVSKDVYKALKKPYKPLEICNLNQGYVADLSTGCQIFYICLGNGAGEPMMCPNGTLFNQDVLVCDWWYNVECSG